MPQFDTLSYLAVGLCRCYAMFTGTTVTDSRVIHQGQQMNPVDILRQAFDAVIKAEIPDDLREIAFSKAVDLIHAPVTTSTQNRSTAYDRQTSNGEVLVEQADEDSDIIDRMASRLEVDIAIIERVFREHDGEPHLKLLTNQLPSGKTPATREIALLITAARQSLGNTHQ